MAEYNSETNVLTYSYNDPGQVQIPIVDGNGQPVSVVGNDFVFIMRQPDGTKRVQGLDQVAYDTGINVRFPSIPDSIVLDTWEIVERNSGIVIAAGKAEVK